jgi:hypothetical protein
VILTALLLAQLLAAQGDPAIDGPTLFAALQRYHASFRDVTLIHEGSAQFLATQSDGPSPVGTFQSFYAYRSDGASLLDAFGQQPDKPKGREIYALLHNRLEGLNATPDAGDTPIRLRTPYVAPGGPGSLGRAESPERIFLAWYFPTLGEPAEHDFKALGWEDVDGQRCLKVSFLRQPRPRLKGWVGGLPYMRFWIDPQRDCYPLRYEYYRGDDLEVRCEITRMERLHLPDGRAIWMPVEGKTWGFFGRSESGKPTMTKEPASIDTHKILVDTVKFNQGLSDGFFSVKKHALVASDEGLRKLQRELESEAASKAKRVPADPESRRKRLDEALEEADRQAKQLEASSALRSGPGWLGVLPGGMGAFGVALLGVAAYWYWKHR